MGTAWKRGPQQQAPAGDSKAMNSVIQAKQELCDVPERFATASPTRHRKTISFKRRLESKLRAEGTPSAASQKVPGRHLAPHKGHYPKQRLASWDMQAAEFCPSAASAIPRASWFLTRSGISPPAYANASSSSYCKRHALLTTLIVRSPWRLGKMALVV